MLYLAQVQRQPVRKIELHLLAVQNEQELWMKLAEIRIVSIKFGLTTAADNSLVLVKFDASREVTEIIEGTNTVPLILHKLSLRLLKLLAKEPEFTEWHDSLTYQSTQLAERAVLLQVREEDVLLRETYLTIENARLKKELASLEKTKQALGRAWEQVRFEQKRLDELDKA